MSSTSELITEIARYEWMLEKVEAYRTEYSSSDAELTIAIIRNCIERMHKELSHCE